MPIPKELVLCYTPAPWPESAKVKGILAVMGARIKNVGPDQAGERVGWLAGLPGFAPLEAAPSQPIPTPMLVLSGFSGPRLDAFLRGLKKAGVSIPYKAVLTETNSAWPLCELYGELVKEHELTRGGKGD